MTLDECLALAREIASGWRPPQGVRVSLGFSPTTEELELNVGMSTCCGGMVAARFGAVIGIRAVFAVLDDIAAQLVADTNRAHLLADVYGPEIVFHLPGEPGSD